MASKGDIELIEEYLGGNLSDQENKICENRMTEDPAFKQLVSEQQFIRDAMAGVGHQDFEQSLKRLTKKNNRVVPLNWVKWAAAVVPLLALGTWWLVSTSSIESLADQMYISPVAQLERGEEDDDLTLAMTAFSDGNLEASIDYFETIPLENPNSDLASYYKGHALYQLGRWEEARTLFLQLTSSGDSNLQQEAEWYAVLAGIQMTEDTQIINKELEAIANNPGHFHQAQAQELLDL